MNGEFRHATSIYFFPTKKEFREGNGLSVNVWFQSRSIPARGRVGLEAHCSLSIIDSGNVFISTYSSLSLADYVAATNRLSQTALFQAKIDVALRDAYATVVGVDVLDPSGHDANLHEDPDCVHARPVRAEDQSGWWRLSLLLRADQLLEVHEQHSAEDLVHGARGRRHKKGPLDLSHRLDRPEFVRQSEQSYAVGTIFLQQEKPHRAEA
jgi:hypothetical protein